MKSDKLLRIITLVIFLLFGLTIIFFFSEQDGSLSHKFSTTVAGNIANYLNRMFSQGMDSSQLAFLTKILDAPIRKMAHVIEYAFLGFLSFAGLRYVDGKKVKGIGIWLMIALIVAAASVDEINQFYSGGRGASIKDVVIDTVSGVIGMYLFVILTDLLHRIRDLFKHLMHRGSELTDEEAV